MPADGETAVIVVTNPSNGSAIAAPTWLWCYLDATTNAVPYSLETQALPNPAHAAAAYGSTASPLGPIIVNTSADTTISLNPTLSTPTAAGVNQLVTVATDGSANLLPVLTEIVYSPLYLFPL